MTTKIGEGLLEAHKEV